MNKNSIRIMIASAIGALVSIELGKHVSEHPAALCIWGIIGWFLGFILSNPKEFVHAVIQAHQHEQKLSRQRKDFIKKREAARREIANERKEAYHLLRWIAFMRSMFKLNIWGWFYLEAAILTMGMQNPEARTLVLFQFPEGAYIVIAFIIWVRVSIDDFEYEYEEMYEGRYYIPLNDATQNLRDKAKHHGGELVKSFLGPFWVMWWLINHLKFIAHCGILLFAKACSAVVSLERYTAALGAIVGYIVGWNTDRSEVVGMLTGAVVGGGSFAIAKLLLRYLPDPNSRWPSPNAA